MKNKKKKDDINWVVIGLSLGLLWGIIFKNLSLGMLLGTGLGGAISLQKKKTR